MGQIVKIGRLGDLFAIQSCLNRPRREGFLESYVSSPKKLLFPLRNFFKGSSASGKCELERVLLD